MKVYGRSLVKRYTASELFETFPDASHPLVSRELTNHVEGWDDVSEYNLAQLFSEPNLNINYFPWWTLNPKTFASACLDIDNGPNLKYPIRNHIDRQVDFIEECIREDGRMWMLLGPVHVIQDLLQSRSIMDLVVNSLETRGEQFLWSLTDRTEAKSKLMERTKDPLI